MELEGPRSLLRSVPDDELLRRAGELVSQKRRVEADLVAHIGEIDERRLYARFASSSMFGYCTQVLHLSEAGAYRRITIARAARHHPMLLPMLRDGRVHLSALAAVVSHLTPDNRDAILARVTHTSKREIEALLAELSPRPDAPARIRKLPDPQLSPGRVGSVDTLGRGASAQRARVPATGQTVGTVSTPAPVRPEGAAAQARPAPLHRREATVEALSPGRYKVQFTASAALRDKLERLAALLRSEVPDGDLATIVERAVTEKLERLEARRFARTAFPRKSLETSDTRPATRHIPAAVRRAVHERDAGRCRFVDEQGQRCREQHALEFHHRFPFGRGGDHSPRNLSLLCPRHNRHLAEYDYGRAAIRQPIPRGVEPRGGS
jgi:hypothetical protein